MLFNSYVFIFGFLPVTLILYYVIAGKLGSRYARWFLVLASLFFYSWWDVRNLPILLASILVNYGAASRILISEGRRRKAWLFAGLFFDLGLLGYFKYTAFAVRSLNLVLNAGLTVPRIMLPLGISFFTFTQIACLVDSYREGAAVRAYTKSGYFLFVTIFPHLIAGPILYHKDMIPQFMNEKNYRFNYANMNRGLLWFALGLAKKVLIADTLSVYVADTFSRAANLSTIDAWMGTFAYTLQLYFDFSGYSEMAVGLGLMLNFTLPLNFNSPYHATSIIDFWRRWHMTLSGFLKKYIYIPLGGNRTGHQMRNILITMAIAGLWHGAGWTFIFWGVLHGIFSCVNHLWRRLGYKLPRPLGWALTFMSVNFAWVFFRADNFKNAFAVLSAMAGMSAGKGNTHIFTLEKIGIVFLCFGICMLLPSVGRIISKHFRPGYRWAIAAALALFCSIIHFYQGGEFLYFQF